MFPQVADAATTVQAANSTGWTMNVPAHQAGDILLAMIGVDGSPAINSIGTVNGVAWNVLTTVANGTNNRLGAAWLRATSNQPTPTTVALAFASTEQGVVRCLRIAGAHATSAPEAGVATTGSSTLPDPPSLNPAGWDVEDTLWIALSNTDAAVGANTYPANMDVATGFSDISGGGNGAGLHTCRAERAVATLDPGTFTLSATETWVAQTIAIRPAPYVPQVLYGAMSMPISFQANVVGRLNARSSFTQSFIFGATINGVKRTIQFGSFAMPITFGSSIDGKKRIFGQISFPIIFSKDVRATKKTFGQISLPIIFGKEVVGRKKTFGQISKAFVFGATTQGQRRLFGKISFPINFNISAGAGRVRALSRLIFPITLTIQTNAQRPPSTMTLNDAEAIYLGTQLVVAVYIEGQKVWPPT